MGGHASVCAMYPQPGKKAIKKTNPKYMGHLGKLAGRSGRLGDLLPIRGGLAGQHISSCHE